MGTVVDSILNVNAVLVYVIVTTLVFAEDALFVGFVLPGETAAVLGGVMASRGHVELWFLMVLVILAAVVGDSVGYEVGKRFGTRLLKARIFDKHRHRLDDAQAFLRRRGGAAVFLGRFVAFFRAVMPALAGTARMPYRLFLTYNAIGGIVWGAGFVLLGFLAGNSYQAVARSAGEDIALVFAGLAVAALIVWQVRRSRRERLLERDPADPAPDGPAEP